LWLRDEKRGMHCRDLHQPSAKTDYTPEPEAPSAQSEAPSARPKAPSVQPEVPSAPEGEALRVEEERSGVMPNRNWPKLSGWRDAPSRSSCWGMGRSSTTAAPLASSSDASPSPKVRSSYERYTRGLATITQHLEPLLETPSDKVSTGRRWWPTPLELSTPAKGVSSMQGRTTPYRRHPGATRTPGKGCSSSPKF
jgi:hypothetical protein